ncbi:hypothetical protein [Microbacterium sp. Leaf351]|uniref:hypothetical protein n=1 Tax=Microbacterium sp. Leaf351 TaxID=1736348 RepID=UPI001F419789|nr:hypothetical protein [Microbacterium sp. Leaf351]
MPFPDRAERDRDAQLSGSHTALVRVLDGAGVAQRRSFQCELCGEAGTEDDPPGVRDLDRAGKPGADGIRAREEQRPDVGMPTAEVLYQPGRDLFGLTFGQGEDAGDYVRGA